jgi:transcriptional regulator with XRE-family HTH domain
MPLFLREIYSRDDPVLFSTLQQRLIRRLNDEIRAGKLTERGLARRAGLSQPHVHNLLKGIRSPTAESADAMLRAISAGVSDLIDGRRAETAAVSVAVLRGAAGPGGTWDDQADSRVQVECKLLAGISQPAIVRILADNQMGGISGYALVDLRAGTDPAFPRGDLYVIGRPGETRLRYVRIGRELVYFPTSSNLNRPGDWESEPRDIDLAGIVRARVCYLEESYPPAASL